MQFEDEQDRYKGWWVPIGLVSCFVVFLAVTSIDAGDEEKEQEQYCKMVQAHMKDKTKGWPDFNGNYKELCEEEEKK